MAVTKTTLREKVRKEAGDISKVEVIDEVIEDIIDKSLIELGRWISSWGTFSFKSEKDMQEYDVDESVNGVLMCSWGLASNFSSLGEMFGKDFNFIEGSTFPYDIETDVYKVVKRGIEVNNVEALYDWQFREQDRKLILIPAPSEDDIDIYYIGEKDWTLETCPAKYERYLVKWCTAQLLRTIARKRMRMSAPSVSGGLVPWNLTSIMMADADKLLQEFEEEMRQEAIRGSL